MILEVFSSLNDSMISHSFMCMNSDAVPLKTISASSKAGIGASVGIVRAWQARGCFAAASRKLVTGPRAVEPHSAMQCACL